MRLPGSLRHPALSQRFSQTTEQASAQGFLRPTKTMSRKDKSYPLDRVRFDVSKIPVTPQGRMAGTGCGGASQASART